MTDPPSPNSVPIPDELVERGARAIMESASGRAVIPPSYPACQRYARAVLEAALPRDELVVSLTREETTCILSAFNMCRHHGGANKYVDDVEAKLERAALSPEDGAS